MTVWGTHHLFFATVSGAITLFCCYGRCFAGDNKGHLPAGGGRCLNTTLGVACLWLQLCFIWRHDYLCDSR